MFRAKHLSPELYIRSVYNGGPQNEWLVAVPSRGSFLGSLNGRGHSYTQNADP